MVYTYLWWWLGDGLLLFYPHYMEYKWGWICIFSLFDLFEGTHDKRMSYMIFHDFLKMFFPHEAEQGCTWDKQSHIQTWDVMGLQIYNVKKLPFGVLLIREGIHAGYRWKRRFSQHRPATSVSGVVDNFVLTISNQLIWLLQKRGQNDTLWWWLTVRHG